jgi:ribonuclease BN (tRNA processing enzyme)
MNLLGPHRRALFRWAAAIVLSALSSGQAVCDSAPPKPPPLELVVLGSGGPGALGRAGSCHLLLIDGQPRLLVDAGPGCFVRIGETGLSLEKLDLILLTHLHADHAGDLPGLIKARAVALHAPIQFRIFGPEGTRGKSGAAWFPSTGKLVQLLFGSRGAFAYLPDFAGHISFQVKDLPAVVRAGQAPEVVYSENDLAIRAIPGHHDGAPATIYRIDHAGKSIVFSGDIDAEGLDNLRTIAAGVSLMVFNAAVLDAPRAPPILYTLHTPPGAIGRVAKQSGAQALLLAHLSPATEGNRDEVVASIRQSYGGPVTFAEDKMRILP